jgi:hypothetical protein
MTSKRKSIFPLVIGAMLLCGGRAAVARQSAAPFRPPPPATTWSVTIVLPPRVVAGQLATLAVFGVDGHLAPDVSVELKTESGAAIQHVTTDQTGRASFKAPETGSTLIAEASGASAAALIDTTVAQSDHPALALPSFISLHDRFSICAPNLRGNADSNRVDMNGIGSLVLAASPECLVALPGSKLQPGPADVSVIILGKDVTAKTTLVSLEFEPPDPPLLPGQKGSLIVALQGSQSRSRIVVENETPGVLRFLRGDKQELLTSGGPRNSIALAVQGVASGDFAFHAHLIPDPDTPRAILLLQTAQRIAPEDQQNDIGKLAERLSHHPAAWEETRKQLQKTVALTIPGACRTLLSAALDAL